MHRRRVTLHPARTACRPATRRLPRSILRRATRRGTRHGTRHVLKYNGPSLRDICSLVGRYLRIAKAFDKKWNPPSRFKTLGTPEERHRRVEEDLERAYGDDAWRALQQPRQPSPAPFTPPAPAAAPVSPPVAQPKEKCDVLAVPMVCSSGIWGLDWNGARPAS